MILLIALHLLDNEKLTAQNINNPHNCAPTPRVRAAAGPGQGTSSTPAHSFGPALVSDAWAGYWLYWLAPLVGVGLAVLLFKVGWLRHLRSDVAKLYHFTAYLVH